MYIIKPLKWNVEYIILHIIGPWLFSLTWFAVIEVLHMENRVLSAAVVNSGLQNNIP